MSEKNRSRFGLHWLLLALWFCPLASGENREVLKLPPFMVEEDRGRSWRIARHEGIEILFRCPEDIAVQAVDRYVRLQRMLGIIMPPGVVTNWSVPTVLVLEDADWEPALAKELTAVIAGRLQNDMRRAEAEFLPNFYYRDQDAEAYYFVLDPYQPRFGSLTVTPDHLGRSLAAYQPPLPTWFITGMVTLLETVIMPVPNIGRTMPGSIPVEQFKTRYPFDRLTVLPLVWRDEMQTKEIDRLVKMAVRASGQALLPDSFVLPPLRTVLTMTAAPESDQVEQKDASMLAALFLRWIFDPRPITPVTTMDHMLRPGPKPEREALWNFLESARREGFSEALFEDCFGWKTGEVDLILRSYLPYACLPSAHFHLDAETDAVTVKSLASVEAKPAETALLRARLNRLSSAYVRQHCPDLLPAYIAQTRRTLVRAIERGDKDPLLQAELGLCEVDAGDDAVARHLLAAAVEAEVAGPRVYHELARIEMAELRLLDAKGRAFGAQCARIEGHLMAGLQRTPKLPQGYALLFELWLRQGVNPTTAQSELIAEGAGLFPDSFRVVYAAMLLHASSGNTAAAIKIGRRSKAWIGDAAERQKLLQLMESLDSRAS